MKILIKNCNLISVSDKKEKYIENIDILINDNIIEKVEKDIKQEENYKIINAKGSNVVTTIVNGKILMEDRKLNINNEKEICEKCNSIIKRISK